MIIIMVKSRTLRGQSMYHEWGTRECIYDIGENPEGKKPLGTTRRRWVVNIETYLGDLGWGSYGLDLSG
jgi:hypothetical protein